MDGWSSDLILEWSVTSQEVPLASRWMASLVVVFCKAQGRPQWPSPSRMSPEAPGSPPRRADPSGPCEERVGRPRIAVGACLHGLVAIVAGGARTGAEALQPHKQGVGCHAVARSERCHGSDRINPGIPVDDF